MVTKKSVKARAKPRAKARAKVKTRAKARATRTVKAKNVAFYRQPIAAISRGFDTVVSLFK